jgi:hypothetical protein
MLGKCSTTEPCPQQLMCLLDSLIGFTLFPLKFYLLKKAGLSWALVAYTCNPSYSGGRDQEDRGSKPTPGK